MEKELIYMKTRTDTKATESRIKKKVTGHFIIRNVVNYTLVNGRF